MNIDFDKIVNDVSVEASKEAVASASSILSLPEDIADDVETYKLLIAYTNSLVAKSLEEYHKTIMKELKKD
ncbi:hypothetical protein BD780_002955 [Clostridium tetanomorphum]|uniref:Uncharacterized protein n=1 Tax=Clostridium tetanomorphum TaxID=1553 RepID=A0A923E687_CLOTT|nr:hypothetical protein [Clostridium tetanomorphum]KAJ53703.1 hypothetical protein CTM_00500 [Clostridium tetanomorphum DSM 665]MBC2397215.1 hypothetical protein [Clostridium tetanomorphum]MBP1862430.1 hypothetical protein [Clostridium tetanomorphum]NRS85730.1 hypothetical protein [Clostridium tetanomorphum]NRZ96261.1 hypothetical protein [Clostridium tetanomorphum]